MASDGEGVSSTLPVVLRRFLEEVRSVRRLLQIDIDINTWMARLPTPAEVRPKTCPGCERAGAPLGGRLGIVGHGCRGRAISGPIDHEDKSGTGRSIQIRRFRCRHCRAVITVAPRGVLPRRRFTSFAIAWGLALFGLMLLSTTAIRERLTPWRAAPWTVNPGWATLLGWARAVRGGRLFPELPRPAASANLRRVAERAAIALSARGPPDMDGLSQDLRAGYGGLSEG